MGADLEPAPFFFFFFGWEIEQDYKKQAGEGRETPASLYIYTLFYICMYTHHIQGIEGY